MMKAETMEALEGITHGNQDFEKSPGLAGAERGEQFATRSVIKIGQIDRAVALVAQDFDERGPALFRRGLELAVNDAQQVHLQRLDLEILCVSAVGTRK